LSNNDELVAQAELGEEARRFLESDLGKYIIGVARQEAQLALVKLSTADPTNVEYVRSIQNECKVAKLFEEWLIEALQAGEQAMTVFKQQQEN